MKDKQSEIKRAIYLDGCTVSPAQDQTKKSHSFSIYFPAKSKSIFLVASNQKEMDEWINLITQASSSSPM